MSANKQIQKDVQKIADPVQVGLVEPIQTISKQEVGMTIMSDVDSISTIEVQQNEQIGANGQLISKDTKNTDQDDRLRKEGLYSRVQVDNLDIETINNINSKTSAELNKKMFIDDFGIKFEIPSLYVQDSKFYKRQPEYSVQLINYVVPMNSKMLVQKHDDTKKTETVNIENILDEKQKGGAVLRLVKIVDHQQETIGETILEKSTSTLMRFSDDGDLFAYYDIDNQRIRIINIGIQINLLIEKIARQDFLTNFDAKTQKEDISFIKRIEFDKNLKYFVGYGDQKLFILNLKSKMVTTYVINTELYNKIYTIRFESDLKKPDKFICMIGCSKLGSKQICFFNAYEYINGDHRHLNKEESHNHHHEIISLSYFNELSVDAKVEISKDMQEMVLTNEKENYIIERNEKNGKKGEVTQKNLNQLQNKKVLYIKCDKYGFFFVASRDYDSNLDVQHSHREENFAVNFVRQIEPGIIKVFDFNISSKQINTLPGITTSQWDNTIRMLSLRDDEFLVDEANYKEDITKELGNWIKGSSVYSYKQYQPQYYKNVNNAIRAFGFNWPYFSFSGLGNDIVVINCFDHKMIHQVQLGKNHEKMDIIDTYITDTNDLFVAVKVKYNQKNIYHIYYIDLDASNIRENPNVNEHYKKVLVFDYKEEDVGYKPLISIHVRGSSRKDQNLNTMQVIFFLHEGKIFQWIGNNDHKKPYPTPIFVCNTVSTMLYIENPNIFYFLDKKTRKDGGDGKDSEVISQEIKQVTIQFNGYLIQTVYKANNEQQNIIQFNLDVPEKKLIILSEPKNISKKSYNVKANKRFSIFDLNQSKIEYDIQITQEQVIGRLMSGIFQISNGHIYFSNNVIKIRYDLICQSDGAHYNQKQAFDDYYNIIQIDNEAQIKSETPLVSLRCHRFAYMIANKHKFSTKLLLFLPYPHERRIHLNRKKVNTDYFYTAIQTKYEEELEYHQVVLKHDHSLNKQVTGREEGEKNNLPSNVLGKVKHQNSFQKLRRKSMSMDQKKMFTSIVCMNLTEQKFYVYTLNGLLFHRCDYSQQVKDFGMPVASSQNGQNFIFKRTREKITLGDAKWKDNAEKERALKEQLFTFEIITLSCFGLKHVKTIKLQEIIQTYLQVHEVKLLEGKSISRQQKLIQDKNERVQMLQNWIESTKFENLTDDYFTCQINDTLDFCVFLKQNLSKYKYLKKDNSDKGEEKNRGFYYFEKGTYGLREKTAIQPIDTVKYLDPDLKNKDLPQTIKNTIDVQNAENYTPPSRSFWNSCFGQPEDEQAQKFLISDNHSHMKFVMNNKYLFFYDDNQIQFIDFRKDEMLQNLDIQMIDFDNDQKHGKSQIKYISTGSNSNEICIVVGHPSDNDSLFLWDMDKNTEIEAFDAGKGYHIIWDRLGKMIIINEEKSVLTNEKCSVNVYDYQKKLKEMIEEGGKLEFSLDKGHRFDDMNHNWMILGEYISLGFSYMTFVIKDEIEKRNKDLIGNYFDIEPYNYIRNKSTSFLDGSFVKNNYSELKGVLKNMKKLNIGYIELITYPQNARHTTEESVNSKFTSQINTVLKMAIDEDNTRNIDLVLQYMSLIQFNSTSNFISLFPKLIEYQSFMTYLTGLPKQTRQLSDVQTEIIGTTFDPNILYAYNSSNIFINRGFFNKEKNLESISQQVVAMRVDMFLDYKYGQEFLSQVLNTQNLDMYNIQSLQMIIQFIYKKIQKILITYMFPIYIGQLVSFEYTWRTFEQYMKLIDEDPPSKQKLLLRNRLFKVTISNTIFGLIQLFINIRMILWMKWRFFRRYPSWLDIIFGIMNLGIIVMIAANIKLFQSEDGFKDSYQAIIQETFATVNNIQLHKATRIAEMIGLIVIWSKFMYFLSLLKEVAPLIDMIGKIFQDMLWFCGVFILFALAFSFAFFIIAQNQIQFDGVAKDAIAYAELPQSIEYIFMTVLGGSDHSMFGLGKATQEQILWFLFFASTLILFITLLPMLIAIMGQSFNVRNGRTNEIRIRNELHFIVDNWHLLGFSVKKKKEIKYVLTPFRMDEGDEQFEQLQDLKETIIRVQENQGEIKGQLKTIDTYIQKIQKKKNQN